jgi:hypothetical protein
LDGWESYIQAIGARLDVNGADACDRVQATKRWLRDSLEHLENEACEAETLSGSACASLHRAICGLRKGLGLPRPEGAESYASQKQLIVERMVATERELDALTVCTSHSRGTRLNNAIEQTVRRMLKVAAEFEAGDLHSCAKTSGPGTLPSAVERELAERLAALAQAIAAARRMADEDIRFVESEIVSGIARVRELAAMLPQRRHRQDSDQSPAAPRAPAAGPGARERRRRDRAVHG